jgi:hypothetical protein
MSQPDTTLFLNLVRFSDKDGPVNDWSRFENSPEELLDYFVNNFGIDPAKLNAIQRISIGDAQPELDTIWINTGSIPFIGIPIAGQFVKFYQRPINSPFVLINQSDLGNGVAPLTEEQREEYGLPALTGTAFWAMLLIET